MSNETNSSRFNVLQKVTGVTLAAALVSTSFIGLLPQLTTATTIEAGAATDYNLADNIQDGTILHCFDWKFNDIKDMLPEIAEAGFTSVQTSPAQQACGSNIWWEAYQPLGFYVGNTFGTKEELKALCTEADKYGIKIIVDVVANHLAGDHSNIQSDLKDSQYWHSEQGGIDYSNRWQIHQRPIGMPDINSEHSYVQQKVAEYIKELESIGVDGIRWDAAKHIAVPSENSCNFWPTVTSGTSLWHYGEILDDPVANNDTLAASLMKEYTNYISVTDSGYCATVRMAFRSGSVTSSIGNYSERGVAKNKLVYWAESHDTYSNDNADGRWDSSQFISQNKIDRAYAVVASQSYASALYFSRPSQTSKNSIKIGEKGSTHFTSPEVAQVNRFHNAMVGQKEYNTTSNNCAVICREKGAVIVAGSGENFEVSVTNGGGLTAPGTYVDQVSGNTWTVTSSTISGKIGSSGIAVLYNPGEVITTPSATATPGSTSFTTDTLSVKLGLKNATSGSYTTSEGASGSFTDGQSITIGSSTSAGGTITLTLTATGDGGTKTSTYTYTKKDPNAVTKIYFDNTGYNWSSVYAYIYSESGASVVENSEWPGVAMTKNSDGLYEIEVPESLLNGMVIFTESSTATTNRYPADQQSGLSINNTSMKFSSGNKWEEYEAAPPVVTPTVKVDKASGTEFTSETLDITLSLANAVSGTYSVDNGPTKTFTSATTVTIGEGKIGDSTVTVKATATGSDGTTKDYTFTYSKKYVKVTNSSTASVAAVSAVSAVAASASSNLCSYYSTNGTGVGANKTITVDGDVSDWSSSMLIAQSAANDDPRVYRPNSMYEIPYDAYAMYAAWDDTNLYLMIEMTNVQDIVAPNDNYPLNSNATVDNIPMFIYIDTGKTSDAIGNNGKTQKGGTLWSCNTTVSGSFNRVIALSSGVGKNGPYIYGGDSTGINEVELGNSTTSGIVYKTGKGILSSKVMGINGGYGEYNNRVLGDMCDSSAEWVDFNTLDHSSSTMDYNYEISIPLSQLGITKSDIESTGLGILFVHSSGASGMDCLPYDITMNDNADQSDPESNPENSLEKSDADSITTSFARVGNGDITPPPPPDDDLPLQVNFGADRSAPQEAGTALTLKGIGYGGSESGYKYEFIIDGTTVQASSSTATYTWNLTSGSHTIKCVITDSEGNTATSTKTYTAEGSTPITELKNNSTISATTITKGNAVTLTGSASGGTAPYQYTMLAKHSSASSWTTLKSYDTTTTKSWTPASSGTYTVAIKVKDSAGKVVEKTFTLTVNAGTSALTNNSTISATTITKGTEITMTGKASGGTAPYRYTMVVKHSTATSWTTLKAYSTTATKKWTPASTGTYKVAIKVKDSAGKVVEKLFTLTVNASALTNSSTLSATTITKGTEITMTGKASGGTAPYQYTMLVKHSTATSWTTLKAYSTTATNKWTPALAGTYKVAIKVKDSAGKVVEKLFTLTVKATELVNESQVSTVAVTKGKEITLTGKASGGTGVYQYAMYAKHSTASSYTTLKDFSTTATKKWTPANTGTYSVIIRVKDSNGTTKDRSFPITVTAPALTNTSTLSATTITKGTAITMTGKATGGTAPYQYQMVVKHSTDSSWTLMKDYNTTATLKWTPAKTGTYKVAIKVKDSAGKIVEKLFTLTVNAPALTNSSTISATTITKGTAITMTGKASGGTAPYQYAMVVKHSTASSWTVLKNYSTTATKSWTPALTGTYKVAIKVKDSDGKIVEKLFTLTVNPGLTNNSTISATSIMKGTEVTITGKASYGTPTYYYQVLAKHSSASSYTTLKDYSTTATKKWTPANTGTYTVVVKVQDMAGTISTKTFTLTVKDSV